MGIILIYAINWFANLVVTVIVVMAILSWLPATPGSFISKLYSVLARFTEPILAPFERLMSRFNTGPLDFSPLIAILVIEMLARLLTNGRGRLAAEIQAQNLRLPVLLIHAADIDPVCRQHCRQRREDQRHQDPLFQVPLKGTEEFAGHVAFAVAHHFHHGIVHGNAGRPDGHYRDAA